MFVVNTELHAFVWYLPGLGLYLAAYFFLSGGGFPPSIANALWGGFFGMFVFAAICEIVVVAPWHSARRGEAKKLGHATYTNLWGFETKV